MMNRPLYIYTHTQKGEEKKKFSEIKTGGREGKIKHNDNIIKRSMDDYCHSFYKYRHFQFIVYAFTHFSHDIKIL